MEAKQYHQPHLHHCPSFTVSGWPLPAHCTLSDSTRMWTSWELGLGLMLFCITVSINMSFSVPFSVLFCLCSLLIRPLDKCLLGHQVAFLATSHPLEAEGALYYSCVISVYISISPTRLWGSEAGTNSLLIWYLQGMFSAWDPNRILWSMVFLELSANSLLPMVFSNQISGNTEIRDPHGISMGELGWVCSDGKHRSYHFESIYYFQAL